MCCIAVNTPRIFAVKKCTNKVHSYKKNCINTMKNKIYLNSMHCAAIVSDTKE